MRRALVLPVVLLAPFGCGERGGERGLTVFAAASLTDAFGSLGEAFEEATGSDVTFSFAGSSALREQILAGAPADVIATADEATIDALVQAGVAGDPELLAANQLQLAVPAGNPAGVTGLADLADDDLLVGLCAAEVPCGRLAREVLTAAGVTPSPDTEEPDVRALLTKLAEAELDVGLVYRSDVAAAGGAVEVVADDLGPAAATTYPIAVLTDAADPDLAAEFVTFVRSAGGRAILLEHGFTAAP